ncbi:MAG: ribosomal protein S18-alanine N-acetyltransferase [Gemmatimonadota bacterium]
MDHLTLPFGHSIEPMAEEHVGDVARIEAESFTTPWSEATFAGLLTRDGVVTLVLSDGERRVVGYSILWCILDQGELANIAITPSRRGQGLGRILLSHVVREAGARGVAKLFLEVRASNDAALRMYEAFGFERVGVRRDYYDRPKEDAHVMLMQLPARTT